MSRYHTCSHDLVCIFVWSICNFYSHELTWFPHENSHIIAKIASFNEKHASKRERWFWIFLYESNMRFKINFIWIQNTVGDAVFIRVIWQNSHMNKMNTFIENTHHCSNYHHHRQQLYHEQHPALLLIWYWRENRKVRWRHTQSISREKTWWNAAIDWCHTKCK